MDRMLCNYEPVKRCHKEDKKHCYKVEKVTVVHVCDKKFSVDTL